jgi:hypothetical protein
MSRRRTLKYACIILAEILVCAAFLTFIAYRDAPRANWPLLSGLSAERLPASVDLTAKAGPTGNQKDVPACSSWELAGMMNYWAKVQQVPGAPFAPMSLFSSVKLQSDGGALTADLTDALERKGIVPQSQYPQGNYDYTHPPTTAERAVALKYRATATITVFDQDTSIANKELALKQALATGHPVLLSALVFTPELSEAEHLAYKEAGKVLDRARQNHQGEFSLYGEEVGYWNKLVGDSVAQAARVDRLNKSLDRAKIKADLATAAYERTPTDDAHKAYIKALDGYNRLIGPLNSAQHKLDRLNAKVDAEKPKLDAAKDRMDQADRDFAAAQKAYDVIAKPYEKLIANSIQSVGPKNPVVDMSMSIGKADGHALLAFGYNAKGVVVQNSWGKGWGRSGFATLTWEYFDKKVIRGAYNNGFISAPGLKTAA